MAESKNCALPCSIFLIVALVLIGQIEANTDVIMSANAQCGQIWTFCSMRRSTLVSSASKAITIAQLLEV